MSLIRYERTPLFTDLQREINRLFDVNTGREEGALAGDWTPAVDISEEEDAFWVHADVPGVKPEDIEVTCENGVLTVQGERTEKTNQEQDGFRRVERVRGRFVRRFTLPDTINAEAIEARAEHGVLEVRIPKGEKSQPRRISVGS